MILDWNSPVSDLSLRGREVKALQEIAGIHTVGALFEFRRRNCRLADLKGIGPTINRNIEAAWRFVEISSAGHPEWDVDYELDLSEVSWSAVKEFTPVAIAIGGAIMPWSEWLATD